MLFRDQAVIARICSEIVDHLVEVSAPWDLSAIGEAKLFVRNMGEKLKKLVLDMKEGVHGPIDDFGNVQNRFRWEDAEIPSELLEQILEFLDSVKADFDDCYEHHHLTFLADQLDRKELDEIRNLIEDSDSPLVRLSEWDDKVEADPYLQEYLASATEENLDAYESNAQGNADQKKRELMAEAFADFRRICDLSVAYEKRLNTVLAELQEREKSKWGVDNS